MSTLNPTELLQAFMQADYLRLPPEQALQMVIRRAKDVSKPPWDFTLPYSFPVVNTAILLFFRGGELHLNLESLESSPGSISYAVETQWDVPVEEQVYMTIQLYTWKDQQTLVRFDAPEEILERQSYIKERFFFIVVTFLIMICGIQEDFSTFQQTNVEPAKPDTLRNPKQPQDDDDVRTLDIGLDWRDSERASGHKVTLQEVAEKYSFSLSAVQKRSAERTQKKKVK